MNSLELSHQKKILVIQLRQLGDVILTTPLVRNIRNIYPEAEIHFLTEKPWDQVYRFNPKVNKIITIPRKISFLKKLFYLRNIYKEKYDIVFDPFSNPTSAFFSFFSLAPQRYGLESSIRNFFYTTVTKSSDESEYSAKHKLRMLENFKINIDDCQIEIPISDELKEFGLKFKNEFFKNNKMVAFNVISRREAKIWDKKHYIQLGNWLIEQGFSLFFVYGPGEKEMANEVYSLLEKKEMALIDYPLPNILQLRSILEYCSFYIGNDGGIKHLSVCAHIPTFTIFQNILWSNWTPPNQEKHHVISNCLQNDNVCPKCVSSSTCFKNLTPEQVIAKLESSFLTLIK